MQLYFHDMTQQNWNTDWIGHHDGGGNDKVTQLPMSNVNNNWKQPKNTRLACPMLRPGDSN